MAKLEDFTRGASVKGVLPNVTVSVVDVKWIGDVAVELTYKDPSGGLGDELIYRDQEGDFEVIAEGSPWSFDGDGALFRLVSEAVRIRSAYLFDPLLAVHTSLVDPLPHQITAVYGEMLTRQPLRYLLADDPGAGKTIMTGLLIRELMVRGDLVRCLIVCPGNLVEQWRDELFQRFNLPFDVMTNDGFDAARTGNWFAETPLAICRLDKLSRNEEVQRKLKVTDWDLVVCDEAHKMSAHFFSGEVKATKRYRLGRTLSSLTRNFLVLTATPHNGKEEDFQLFLALMDGDRFEGRFRDGVHTTDTSDLMRRLLKEQLVKFDGTPLFPERIAYTANYALSDPEADLYARVTEYVREEFNRADALQNDKRKGTVGFALTTLQRRLASSPEAIYQSLRRRRERLEKRLREERILDRGVGARLDLNSELPVMADDDLEDLEDAPDPEREQIEETIVDQASAARTITELESEISILKSLEEAALRVRRSGEDKKWDELSTLLQNRSEMFDAHGHRRKLIIFTEYRDTLNYLHAKIGDLIGRPEAVVVIHGAVGREQRKLAEHSFTQDKDVEILVATDAAGEGINLQRAHLMVNYDLPWNPNRLEQRFGRIHRIGQTEVCHLWNLVASETREGEVYFTLLRKLEQERTSLGGRVFDVLGSITFEDRPLRELLLEAVRYGDRPDVRARLTQIVADAVDHDHLHKLLAERAVAQDSMDATAVGRIREDMERAAARRLQPHFVCSFFMEAFKRLGGAISEREPKRYEIRHVPAVIRSRDRIIGAWEPVLTKYERITFEKDLINVPGKPPAVFLRPGHPLLDAVTDLILERHNDLLKQGTVLVDESDPSEDPRVLICLEHSIQDARVNASGRRSVVSRRLQFAEVGADGEPKSAGFAPYLDCRPLKEDENDILERLPPPPWNRNELEEKARNYSARRLVPEHLGEVKRRKEDLILRTMAAVKDRLTTEIAYWDHRAARLKEEEALGRINAKINSDNARKKADELTVRMRKRLEELEQERKLSPLPPIVKAAALIVPGGLLRKLKGAEESDGPGAHDRNLMEAAAMAAVMKAERGLGFIPKDVSRENLGYDVESRCSEGGRLRFIEVKGRAKGATTVAVTKNELLTALNKPDDFILAVVLMDGDETVIHYVRRPFQREPDFGVTGVMYSVKELIARGESPS